MKSRGSHLSQIFRLLVLFLSGIFAHELAGGSFLSISHLALQLAAVLLILIALRNLNLEGPALALAIAIVQSSSHFIIGGGSNSGELGMSVSHVTSGIFAYLLISNFEAAWNFIKSLILDLALPSAHQKFNCPKFYTATPHRFATNIHFFCLIRSLQFRGPPALKGN